MRGSTVHKSIGNAATVESSYAQESGRHRVVALAVVCLAMLMNTLDGSVVNVALPSIQNDLGFAQADLTWVVNAYLISFGSFLLLAGRLGDLIGRKRVFLLGVTIFTLASVACGVADDQSVLIAARFVQGVGGAASASVIIALIVTDFPDPIERAKAMSAYIFVAVGGASIGLLVGGAITQKLDWHWIFFINIPIGLVTVALGRALIAETPGIGLDKGVDVLGSVLVTSALMMAIYAIVEAARYGWASAHTLGFGGLAIAMLAAFLVLESRIENPIMPLRILRIPGLASSTLVRGFLATGLFSVFFLGALYLERVRGYDPLQTGLAFLPLSLAVGVLSTGITARLMARFGTRRVTISGLVLSTAGLLLMLLAGEHASYLPLLFCAFLTIGLGAGLTFMPLLAIAMEDVPRADAGVGSGIVNVSMQISAALGLAILGTISTNRANDLLSQGHPLASALTSGYHRAFLIAAACVAVGLVFAIFVLRAPETEAPPA